MAPWPFMLRRPVAGLAAAALGRAPADGEWRPSAHRFPTSFLGAAATRVVGAVRIPLSPCTRDVASRVLQGAPGDGVGAGERHRNTPTPQASVVSRAGLWQSPSERSRGLEDWVMRFSWR